MYQCHDTTEPLGASDVTPRVPWRYFTGAHGMLQFKCTLTSNPFLIFRLPDGTGWGEDRWLFGRRRWLMFIYYQTSRLVSPSKLFISIKCSPGRRCLDLSCKYQPPPHKDRTKPFFSDYSGVVQTALTLDWPYLMDPAFTRLGTTGRY